MQSESIPILPNPEHTSLVNPDRVRQVVQRSFTGKMNEILGEIFQNAQRAGARTVEVRTSGTGFTVTDDGHGIPPLLSDWHTLLCIAESRYENPDVESNQDPLGVGIHALLAHQQVDSVTFQSGGTSITIDTRRWWSDVDYYRCWQELLVLNGQEVHSPGFRILVTCTPELARQVANLLMGEEKSCYNRREPGPARGYQGVLTILCNEELVDTSIPEDYTLKKVFIECMYQGNRLVVGLLPDRYHRSLVNWYGQIIEVNIHDRFGFQLFVRQGRPVNPLSPTRKGLIHDQALTDLVGFIQAELKKFFFDVGNRNRFPTRLVEYFCSWVPEAENECPYVVVAPYPEPSNKYIDSFEDLGATGPAELRTMDELPLLIDSSIRIYGERSQVAVCGFGLDSFLPLLANRKLRPYHLAWGNQAEKFVKTVWWMPGTGLNLDPELGFFHQPGVWGIGPLDYCEGWESVGEVPVYGFQDPYWWNMNEVTGLVVGTHDPLAFLKGSSRVCFNSNHDEFSYYEVSSSYDESVAGLMRKLIGNAVGQRFCAADLAPFTNGARPLKIEFVYASSDSKEPGEIVVTDDRNQSFRLKLYG